MDRDGRAERGAWNGESLKETGAEATGNQGALYLNKWKPLEKREKRGASIGPLRALRGTTSRAWSNEAAIRADALR